MDGGGLGMYLGLSYKKADGLFQQCLNYDYSMFMIIAF